MIIKLLLRGIFSIPLKINKIIKIGYTQKEVVFAFHMSSENNYQIPFLKDNFILL